MNAKLLSIVAAAGLLMGTAAVYAQGASENAPGQRMQSGEKPPVEGRPGASGYAPGQQMREEGSKPGQPGASGYAPGQQDRGTTGQRGTSGGGGMGDSRGGSR